MTAIDGSFDDWDEEEHRAQSGSETAPQINPHALVSLLDAMLTENDDLGMTVEELQIKVHEMTYRISALDRRVRELESKNDRPE